MPLWPVRVAFSMFCWIERLKPTQTLYLSFAHGERKSNATRIIKARLEQDQLKDVEVIFTTATAKNTAVHYGGRMVQLNDGTLVITVVMGLIFERQRKILIANLVR